MLDRKKLAMIVAEFLGAGILSLAMYSLLVRTSFPLFPGVAAAAVAAMFVYALGANAPTFGNPAVAVGLWTVRKIQTLPAVVSVAAQLLGGLGTVALLQYLVGQSLESMAAEFSWKVFVAEAIGALVFTFGVAAAVYNKYEGGALAATVGVSLFAGILIASIASNALINPAVAVGVQSWNWAYATAPLVGGVIGTNLYAMLYAPVASAKNKKR